MADQGLPRQLCSLLRCLLNVGKGIARINLHGQLEAGPIKDILPGDAVSWLVLASWGCIEGMQDKPGWFEITALGKHYAEGGK